MQFFTEGTAFVYFLILYREMVFIYQVFICFSFLTIGVDLDMFIRFFIPWLQGNKHHNFGGQWSHRPSFEMAVADDNASSSVPFCRGESPNYRCQKY